MVSHPTRQDQRPAHPPHAGRPLNPHTERSRGPTRSTGPKTLVRTARGGSTELMAIRVVGYSSPIEWLIVRPTEHIGADASLAECGELMREANVSALLVDSRPPAI